MKGWCRHALVALSYIAMLLTTTAQANGDTSMERYRVQPGDTLWGITERHRGEAKEWPVVRDANGVNEPRHIQPGDILEIPPLPSLTAEVRHREGGQAWLVKASGERIPLREGMTVAPGDAVETAARTFVSLRLPHGEDVVLPSSSRVVVKRQDRHNSRLYLERGEVEARVPKQQDRHEVLNIDTPTGIVGVRGTHFRVAHADEETRVSTLEGLVALNHANRAADVAAGRGALMNRGQPTRVTDLLPAPRLEVADHAFRQPLRLDLSAVEGAEAYHVQLARDPRFQTVFRDQRSDALSFRFDAVPGGFYYARGSAIDALGIEGLYGRQLVLHQPVEASLVAGDEGYAFHWTEIPDVEYRLQLSEDEAFGDLFMDRSFTSSQGVTLSNLPTEDFFWRLKVSSLEQAPEHSVIVASGRQGGTR